MKIRLVLVLIPLLCGLHAHTEPGFVSPESLADEFPEGSRLSVYRILTKADLRLPVMTYDFSETRLILENECVGASPMSLLNQKNCEFLRQCVEGEGYTSLQIPYLKSIHHNDSTVCYKPYNGGGTSFVVQKTETSVHLMTNWHVVDNPNAVVLEFLSPAIRQRKKQERVSLISKLKFDFDLFGNNGQLLLSVDSKSMEIQTIGDVIGAKYAPDPTQRGLAQLVEDFVVLKFEDTEKTLGPALTAISDTPNAGQVVFAVGYPNLTENRSSNSDGLQLFISRGALMDREELLTRFQENRAEESISDSPTTPATNASDVEYQLPQDRGFVYFSNDIVPGNSGGPLVNSDGQVVGLIVKSFSSEKNYVSTGGIALYFPHLLHTGEER